MIDSAAANLARDLEELLTQSAGLDVQLCVLSDGTAYLVIRDQRAGDFQEALGGIAENC